MYACHGEGIVPQSLQNLHKYYVNGLPVHPLPSFILLKIFQKKHIFQNTSSKLVPLGIMHLARA